MLLAPDGRRIPALDHWGHPDDPGGEVGIVSQRDLQLLETA